MNIMMFPRMFSSHDEGWAWLMRVHPSVVKMYFLYVIPMSIIPAAMLLYAADRYGGLIMGADVSLGEAWLLAGLFFVCELLVVPLMGAVMQRLGDVVDTHPAYQDAFAFAAVVPTPLWLASLALFIPSLVIVGLAMAAALFLSGLLIYEGTYRVYQLDDEGKSLLLAGSILAAGLVAWIALMLLGFVSWGWAVA